MDPQQTSKLNNKSHKSLRVFAIILLCLLAIGGVGYSVYAWQQNVRLVNDLSQKEDDNKKLHNEITALKNAVKDTSDEQQDAPMASDEELAQKAAQNFIDAQVLDMKYVATPPRIKGDFATSGAAPSIRPNHIVSGMLLKKANGDWIVIHHGQNGADEDTVRRFAIPDSSYFAEKR